MSKKVIIIGGDAAGLSAAVKIKREAPDWEIIVFEAGKNISYSLCAMPYFVSGDVDNIVFGDAKIFSKKRGVNVKILHKVERILSEQNTVEVLDIENNKKFNEEFDYLFIGTGAESKKLGLIGSNLKNIFYFSEIRDSYILKEFFEKNRVNSIAIIGGGLIGVELSDALSKFAKERVHIYETASHILPLYSNTIANIIIKKMEDNGIVLHQDEKVREFLGHSSVSQVRTDLGTYPADMVIIAIGVRPRDTLAREAGINVDPRGGIIVKDTMQTSKYNIYAGGDCVVLNHSLRKYRAYIPLGTYANRQGRLAGYNIVHGNQLHFNKVFGTQISQFNDIQFGRTGLFESDMIHEKINYGSVYIKAADKSHVSKNNSENHLVLYYNKGNGLILGAEMAGNSLKGYINTLALILQAGMKIDDILYSDMCYAPFIAPVWDIIQIAAHQAFKDLK